MLSLLLLTGCAALFTGPASAPPPPPVAAAPGAAGTSTPVSFAPLEARLNDLLGASGDADQRDRLVALRELMFDLRGRDPAAQRVAYAYACLALDIESRARVQPLDIGVVAQVEESTLEEAAYPAPTVPPVDAVQSARAALAAGRPLDAVVALSGLVSTEAAALRKEAADTWARTEREAAGYAFIEARKLIEPAARLAALTAVRDRLAAINARFPDNAHAADIRANLARVQSDVDAAAKDATR
jgi:hypothetical protein